MDDLFELLTSSETKKAMEHQQLQVAYTKQQQNNGWLVVGILLATGVVIFLVADAYNRRPEKNYVKKKQN